MTLVNDKNVTLKEIMDSMNWSDETVFNGIIDTFNNNNSQFLKNYLANESSIEDSLISCKFNSKACDSNDFEFYRLNEYQKCYKFNAGKYFNGTNKPIEITERYGIVSEFFSFLGTGRPRILVPVTTLVLNKIFGGSTRYQMLPANFSRNLSANFFENLLAAFGTWYYLQKKNLKN
jgi:hypothetical protein